MNKIIDPNQIRQKIVRIAYEILEDNHDEKELIIAGIGLNDEGYKLAERIADALKEFSDLKIELTSINLNKKNPADEEIDLGITHELVDGKVIILVDDVANTGRTLLYAIKPLLDFHPKKIRIAALVDRKHKAFPVCADYVGLSLATTLQEHISVKMNDKKEEGVYLS